MKKYTLKKGSVVSIGKPATQSEEMINALNDFFEKSRMVKSAYLAWKESNGEVGFLLVIDSDEKPQKIIPSIGDICHPFLGKNMMDITYKNTALGSFTSIEVEPFYVMNEAKEETISKVETKKK